MNGNRCPDARDHDHALHGARLGVAAGANTLFAIIQIIVGLAIGSVVVLADAAHQAVDALGLVTAFIAIRVARRPASRNWSYGLGKADALGGFVSALLLLASVGWIVVESVRRLMEPESVEGGGVIAIGLVAIAVNGAGVLLVGHRHAAEAISLRAARLHLLTDLAGSVVVLLAGALLVVTEASWIDPAASLLVSVAVLWSTSQLIRSAIGVLLDRAPSGVSADRVATLISSHRDVDAAHHVHVRSLGAGRHSATAHAVIHGSMTVHRSQEIVGELGRLVHDDLGIEHVTVQVECGHHCAAENEERGPAGIVS